MTRDDLYAEIFSKYGITASQMAFAERMTRIRAVPQKPGTWKCRHYSRPDLFDERGHWRHGIDPMAIN